MIYSIGITLTAFMVVLLLFKSKKTPADTILLLWFFFALIHQTLTYFNATGVYKTHLSFLIGANLPLPLIHAPFLFIYVSQFTGTAPRNGAVNLLHFLPALIFYICMLHFFISPVEHKLFVMNHNGAGFETMVFIKFIAIIISGLVYVVWSLYKIGKYQHRIKDVFSNIENINLQWLKILTYGMGIIWIVVFFGNELQTSIVISLFMLTIGFFGIRQVHIFSNIPSAAESFADLEETPAEPIKYENSLLSDDKKEAIKAALDKQMDEQKLYLNPELSLDSLSTTVNVHPNSVSQYINEVLGLTFYDFINSRRIDEFKRRVTLPESKQLSLLGLAFDCGFNSKASFNRNFKKLTGLTPSEYVHSTKSSAPN